MYIPQNKILMTNKPQKKKANCLNTNASIFLTEKPNSNFTITIHMLSATAENSYPMYF
jgi:hypothetical protein